MKVARARRAWARAAAAAAAVGLWAAAAAAGPAPGYGLQAVPVLDVNGGVYGVEGWLVDEAWVAYLGLGYQLPDPTQPPGAEGAGLRWRMGLAIPVGPDGQVDMRVVDWPLSWVPGWDGTTGLLVSWRQSYGDAWSWRLGATVGNVWVRGQGQAPVRAVVGAAGTRWELAPDLAVRPSVEALLGTGQPEAGGARPLFGAVIGALPFEAGDFRLEARLGMAWPPSGALVPGQPSPVADEVGRLGFRVGGWPAEMLVRGAAPAGSLPAQRAAMGISLERRFPLAPLPRPLSWWPDAVGHLALYADAAVSAPDLSFSRDAHTAVAAGVAAGLTSRAVGELEAFLGVSSGPTVRLGARLRPLP